MEPAEALLLAARSPMPIVSAGEKSILAPHRREICYVFLDLRGFTAFTDAAEPEEVEAVLRDYHAAMGALISAFERHARPLCRRRHPGVLQRSAAGRPIRRSARRRWRSRCRRAFAPLRERWLKQGYDLDLGIGIAKGFATLGAFGFEGRWDYTAIGGVVNLAARLCGEAQAGQILIDRRLRAALDDDCEVDAVGPLSLKGYAQPVPAFALKGRRIRSPG